MYTLHRLIHSLGIHSTLLGYHFLVYAVQLTVQDNTYLLGVTKRLYPEIARHFHTNVSSVDRNLRTALCILWDRGNRQLLQELAGYEIFYRPSNGELIDILTCYCSEHQVDLHMESIPSSLVL